MKRRDIEPTTVSYAQAVEVTGATRLLFISGQTPEGEGGVVSPDFKTQYRQVWANLEAHLKAADMTFDNLVKVTIYLAEQRFLAESRGMRGEIIGDRSPALTILVTGLVDAAWGIEIEAVAAA